MRACAWMRAQQLGVQHARQRDVVGVDRAAGDLGEPLDLAVALADDVELAAVGRRRCGRPPTRAASGAPRAACRRPLRDLHARRACRGRSLRAAAHVRSAQSRARPAPPPRGSWCSRCSGRGCPTARARSRSRVGRGVASQQRHGAHQHARRAEAALRAAGRGRTRPAADAARPARRAPRRSSTSRPSQASASVMQESTGSPSSSTVHAPQSPLSQPCFDAGEAEVVAQRLEQRRARASTAHSRGVAVHAAAGRARWPIRSKRFPRRAAMVQCGDERRRFKPLRARVSTRAGAARPRAASCRARSAECIMRP